MHGTSTPAMFAVTLVLLFIIRVRFPSSRSIADIITARYGESALQTVRKFEIVDFKYRKLELDLEFLNNCIKHELLPTFVRFKVANHQLKSSKVYKDCQMRLLRQEVAIKKSSLAVLNKKLLALKYFELLS